MRRAPRQREGKSGPSLGVIAAFLFFVGSLAFLVASSALQHSHAPEPIPSAAPTPSPSADPNIERRLEALEEAHWRDEQRRYEERMRREQAARQVWEDDLRRREAERLAGGSGR